jgi:hypothetical protein
MTSHIVASQAPTPKLYQTLPPPIDELDDVLAILFTGSAKPTQKDFERTPLLVRRNAVARALEWLKQVDTGHWVNAHPETVPPGGYTQPSKSSLL